MYLEGLFECKQVVSPRPLQPDTNTRSIGAFSVVSQMMESAQLSLLHVAEIEIIAHSLTPSMVMIPVDSEGRPMQELVVRSILQELDKVKRKKDWSMPYHR